MACPLEVVLKQSPGQSCSEDSPSGPAVCVRFCLFRGGHRRAQWKPGSTRLHLLAKVPSQASQGTDSHPWNPNRPRIPSCPRPSQSHLSTTAQNNIQHQHSPTRAALGPRRLFTTHTDNAAAAGESARPTPSLCCPCRQRQCTFHWGGSPRR